MEKNILMETRDLSFKYSRGNYALENINLKIVEGECTVILGGNGAGKSTLFLNLNAVLSPSSGEVFYRGEKLDFKRKSIKAMRKNVGIVFQDPDNQLFCADVFRDVSFGPMNLGLDVCEVRKRVIDSLKKTDVLDLADRPTHELSYGQKKRVAIAGILAMDPDMIILDEPTAGLDPEGVEDIMNLLDKLKNEMGKTILMATHDIDLVPEYGDYAYILNQGKVAFHGNIDEVFSDEDMIRKNKLRMPRMRF